jgi:hypothetical protein
MCCLCPPRLATATAPSFEPAAAAATKGRDRASAHAVTMEERCIVMYVLMSVDGSRVLKSLEMFQCRSVETRIGSLEQAS